MRCPMHSTFHDQRGAVAVFFAILLPLVLAVAALVLDLSRGWENRRLLQNCVDGAALAGAYEADGTSAAIPAIEAAVQDYLATYDNGFCLSDPYVQTAGVPDPDVAADAYSVDVLDNDGDGSLNFVRVTMARGVPTLLARAAGALLGAAAPEFLPVRTHAVAAKGDVREFSGAIPLGLIACDGDPWPAGQAGPWDCPWNDPVYDPVTGECNVDLDRVWIKSWDPVAETFVMWNLKYTLTQDELGFPVKMTIKVNPNGSVDAGNFQALDFPPAGGGANEYRERIAWGWDEWLGDCDVIPTKTGNMVGPTIEGLYDANSPGNSWPDGNPRIARVMRDRDGAPVPPFQPSPPMPVGGHPDNPVLLHDLYKRVVHDLLDHVDAPWDCPRIIYIPILGNPINKGSGVYDVRILAWAVMFLDNKPAFPPGPEKGFVDAYFVDPQKRLMPPDQWNQIGSLDPTSWLPTGIKLVE